MREGALLAFPLHAPIRNSYLTSNIRRWAVQESAWPSPLLSLVEVALGIFFANCSEVKCMFLYVCLCTTAPPPCICTIKVSHKQKQSFRSIHICWKSWRTFCSEDLWPLVFNIAAFSLALCAFPRKKSRENTHLNFCWRINYGQLPLLPSYMGKTMLLSEDYLAPCLTESGVLKNYLWVRYHHFILPHTFAFPVVTVWLQMNTGINPRQVLFAFMRICIFILPCLCQSKYSFVLLRAVNQQFCLLPCFENFKGLLDKLIELIKCMSFLLQKPGRHFK